MQLSPVEFDAVRKIVRDRTAIVLDDDKSYLAETRLRTVAQDEGFQSISELVQRLGKNPSLDQRVIEAMATNETYFFRDLQPFEALRKELLPQLVARRGVMRRINIWSAACASGQEPYSIALLLHEHHCLPDGWSVDLLATDFSEVMLERARQGRYNQVEVNRGLPAALLLKHFERHGLEWRIKDEIRRAVRFARINLIGNWPPLPPLDIIFLRNVLIYFDVPTRKIILGKIRRVLRPDGYLFLGGAETTINIDDAFERVPLDRASCFRLRSNEERNNVAV